MPNNMTVFSEFEARSMSFIFAPGDVYNVQCIGKVECEASIRNITKNCRGTVAKKRTRPTGEGTLKVTAHLPYELYRRLHNMTQTDLSAGVYAYGKPNLHPEVIVTADIYDEDDNEKYRAWPRCTVSTGASQSIENGGDEVAEVELEIGYMPDTYGYGFYEALADDLSSTIKTAWMNNWSVGLMHGEPAPVVPEYVAMFKVVEPVGTENPSEEGWYERTGSEGAYTYAPTDDETVGVSATYYELVVPDGD